LTITIRIVFFILSLTAFFLRVLTRLSLVAGLTRLTGVLTRLALLALSRLITLLTFLLHIVRHIIYFLHRKARESPCFLNFQASSGKLVAEGEQLGWEQRERLRIDCATSAIAASGFEHGAEGLCFLFCF
jgi:hypothetical protein